LYNDAEKTEPWGTPAGISLVADNSPSIDILSFLPERKQAMA
jgi:hypothetical protein